jgi:hypothetical protein
MKDHFKSFYPDETKDKSDQYSSPISQASSHSESPAEIEKQIHMLQKKLSSYERRKQKLLLEQTKSQLEPDQTLATDPHNDTNSQSSQQGNMTGLPNGHATGENNVGNLSVNGTGNANTFSISNGPSTTDAIMSQSQINTIGQIRAR